MKRFNSSKWITKNKYGKPLQEQNSDFQKRQDRLTPGKNPEEFYGDGSLDKLRQTSQESMSNANIKALQTVVGDYSLNKILNTIAVIADKTGKHDEADMIKNLASKIQDFEDEDEMHDDPGDIRIDHDYYTEQPLQEHTVTFTKDDMATLHNTGELVKADDDGKDHTYVFGEDLDEQNTTGGGTSFNAGVGMGYATPKSFKKKKKK